jgi:crotonobetainyl-CoA hydratase
MGMMLTGRHVGQGRLELGFVTAVVPHADLMKRRDAGRRHPGLLADVGARHQAGGDALARCAGARVAMHNQHYSAFVAMARSEDTVEGPRPSPKAQAQLERALRHGRDDGRV